VWRKKSLYKNKHHQYYRSDSQWHIEYSNNNHNCQNDDDDDDDGGDDDDNDDDDSFVRPSVLQGYSAVNTRLFLLNGSAKSKTAQLKPTIN